MANFMVKRVTTFMFSLFGVTRENKLDDDTHLDEFERTTLLPEMRRTINASLNRVHLDVNKSIMKMMKSSASDRESSYTMGDNTGHSFMNN